MKKLGFLSLVLVLGILISGCENSNIFSWTHKKGGSKSTDALLADAQSALIDGDYADAIEYYNKILDKDHDNSEALYGLAAAELKNAGLDIADLIPKLLEQDEGVSDDLLENINFDDIENGTAAAIEALEQIVNGQGDGDIPADDFDVNLNLGIAKTLHAVSSLLNWAEDSGVVEIKDDYSVVVNDDTDVDDAVLKSKLENAVAEVAEAKEHLEAAAATSGNEATEDMIDGFDDFISALTDQIENL